MSHVAADRLLPISALQHLLFCERQCALIHVEREWVENRLTVEGAQLHGKAHAGPDETQRGVRILRAVPLVSHELGLRGVADVVENRPDGSWLPVEYKRGRPKRDDHDRVQVCAQAMCLEERFGERIERAALFYGKTRRRVTVELGESLRQATRRASARLHEMVRSRETPPATVEPKCRRCSLREVCMPEILSASVRRGYLAARAREVDRAET